MDPEEVGDVLNKYFASVFTKEKDMDDGKVREKYIDILGHVNIKEKEVLGVLKNIKIDKAPGTDGIYPKVLWETRREIARVLTEIFVSSLAA
eukprot:g28375.t1